MQKNIILIIILFFCHLWMTAQERRVPLQFNPQTGKGQTMPSMQTKALQLSYLDLPFIDDFARTAPVPDFRLWADQKVFINSNFADNPLSVGVATFDALDSAGVLYEQASSFRFLADQLTSLPIRMEYTPADSIYLSFYYQPQGLGDAPEQYDSLKVEFFAPLQNRWIQVAGFQGSENQPFRLVMLPVTDTLWLHNGFRFRFSNMASLAATAQDPGKIDNDDHWHIDYVRLDKNRTFVDTLLDDVAYVTPLSSLLYDYESVPWSHFPLLSNKLVRPYLKLAYRNNYNLTRKVDRSFTVAGKNYSYNFMLTSENIPGDTLQDYYPDIEKLPSGDGSSAKFLVRSWITTDTLEKSKSFRWNDTISYYQTFSDYYAYDDGTAENGYGISGEGTIGSRFAMRFIQPLEDTLQAIRIYFNRSYQDANQVNFELAAWNNNNGLPGELLFEESSVSIMPQYSGLNHFITFSLSEPMLMPDTFYIGWIQTSETFLNLGLDLNRINNSRSFFNTDGNWTSSAVKGTVMIRPVMGKWSETGLPVRNTEECFRIYPNPADQLVWIQNKELSNSSSRLCIINYSGVRVRMLDPLPESIDVSVLAPGLYFLEFTKENGDREYHKLLIAR